MKYEILRGSDMYNLMDMVNKRINDGWLPQGGVHVIHFPRERSLPESFNWLQAMVKEND